MYFHCYSINLHMGALHLLPPSHQVVELLGKNTALFKLPVFRRLRAALHPLIVEQMRTNYEGTGNAMKFGDPAAAGKQRR